MRALLTSLPLVAIGAGCAGPASLDGDADADGAALATRVDGVVLIERVRTGEGAQTSVGAKFLRHAASTESAERLVGSRLLLPASGECAAVASLEAEDAAAATRSSASGTWTERAADDEVELVDVGDVKLVEPAGVRLAPRAFPDVGELVSGVFYTSPDVTADLPAPGRFVLEGSGTAALEAFRLATDAPADPGRVLVAGVDLASGHPRVQRGAEVLVRWDAPGAEVGRGELGRAEVVDIVYVDVQAAAGQVHRCTFADDGAAILPGALFDGPWAALAVHRLRETQLPLPADGTADGTADGAGAEPGRALVRFDLALVGRVEIDASVEPGG